MPRLGILVYSFDGMVKGKAKLLKNSGGSYSAMDNCDCDRSNSEKLFVVS